MNAYLPAIGAAVLFGIATAMQHRAAHAVPIQGIGTVRLILHLLRNRMWLVGRVADTVAVVLQAVALRSGSLVAVQSIVACGMVAALACSAALGRRIPRRTEVLGSLIVVLGAVLVGRVARANESGQFPRAWRWVVLAALAAAVVATVRVLGTSARSRSFPHPSAVLGAGAGACFAAASAFLKLGSLGVGHGVLRPATLVGVAGFAIAGFVGNVLAQRSFHLGAIAVGLPALVAAEPITALVLGAVLFHERVARNGNGVAGLAGLVVLVVGVWLLGRAAPLLEPAH